MNRRQFLAALAAVPMLVRDLPSLAATEEALPAAPFDWFGQHRFMITFPDGTQWQFMGAVTSMNQKFPVDGPLSTDLTIQPIGPMTIVAQPFEVPVVLDEEPVEAHGTTIEVNGLAVAELKEITPPSIDRQMVEVGFDDFGPIYAPGLRRMSSMTLTLNGKWGDDT